VASRATKADVHEQGVDLARVRKVSQRSGKIDGEQRTVPQILDHPAEALQKETIIFDDKDKSNQNAI
jgi:hypothetical protein